MDELEARARAQLDRLRDVNEQLAAISERETSPDDRVTAEVDGIGALTGLWFAPSAHEVGSAELGNLIVATAAVAAGRAFVRRAAVLEDFNESFAELIASRPSAVGTGSRSPAGTGAHPAAS
jgi:transcriptional regulator NrdR family protein